MSVARAALFIVPVVAALAGCGRDEGSGSPTTPASVAPTTNARRIEGGTPATWSGVSFDLPAGWKLQENQGAAVLTPGNAVQGEELFLLLSDPDTRTFDPAAVDQSIAAAVAQLNPKARPQGSPEDRTFGDVKGRALRYTAKLDDGRRGEFRVFAFEGTRASAIVAIGLADRLDARQTEVDALLASMTKPAAAAPAAGSSVRPELAGQWMWITNFSANSGGRQTDTTLILRADGSFEYRYNHVSSNPFGASWGSERNSGTWTATEDSITFRDAGGARTCTLEKRNHPKNTGDPMIIVDGKAFVTATLRAPW